MSGHRINRTTEDIKRELTSIFRTVKDPRVSDAFLSVVHCDVTKDLSYCTVYISALGQVDAKELMKGLKSASGYLRRELAHTLALRHTPELIFKLDDSIAHGARISKLIDEAIK